MSTFFVHLAATATVHARLPLPAYEVGSVEAIWSNATGRNCKLIRESTKRRDMHAALAYSAQAHGNSSEPVLEVKSALSAMKWDDGCVEYIEPLTGAAPVPRCAHHEFARCAPSSGPVH